MPRTPPTIIAPLPQDPRIFALAKATGLSRREAFGAAAEIWNWIANVSTDGVVVAAAAESMDSVVDVVGFGEAMVAAGLVGVANDGLVLPAELRAQRAEERRGRTADHRGDESPHDRRKRQNAEAAQRYRATKKKTATPLRRVGDGQASRSLGAVAGFEVKAMSGPHGVYVSVFNAMIDGKHTKKFTAGCKAWALETVTLEEALPLLLEKWETLARPQGLNDPPRMVPSLAEFRAEAERCLLICKLHREAAVANQNDDASSRHHASSLRHADASSFVSISSSSTEAKNDVTSFCGNTLRDADASSFRNDDAPSSSLSSSMSSSSNEEEDMRRQGREADTDDDAIREKLAEHDENRRKRDRMVNKFAAALGMTTDEVDRLWTKNRQWLRLQLETRGIDPTTGDPVNQATRPPPERGPVEGGRDGGYRDLLSNVALATKLPSAVAAAAS